MRAVIQRVKSASVTADGVANGQIGQGLLILLGVHENDTEEDAAYLAKKCCGLRIFEDDDEKMNLSVKDVGGAFMVVSNFTLYGDTKKGFRPSFIEAARPEKAILLYEKFVSLVRENDIVCETGVFGADMKIDTVCDGPVTIVMDSVVKK